MMNPSKQIRRTESQICSLLNLYSKNDGTVVEFCKVLNFKGNSKPNSAVMNDTVRGALYEKDTTKNTITIRPNYSLTKIDASKIRLNFFDKVPETISFRGEFYTYDTTKLANYKYIFITNMTTYAIITDNGKDIYLEKENDNSLALPKKNYEDIYSGNGYKITFIHKVIKDGYGISNEIGKLIIENSRLQLIVKIQGGYNMNYH